VRLKKVLITLRTWLASPINETVTSPIRRSTVSRNQREPTNLKALRRQGSQERRSGLPWWKVPGVVAAASLERSLPDCSSGSRRAAGRLSRKTVATGSDTPTLSG
jgi:hypothetical protein